MNDLDQVKETPKVSRRAVAKGAAWTLPVVSLAAAAPTASASEAPCKGCFKPSKGPLGVAAYVSAIGTITITAGVTSSCGPLAYVMVGLGSTFYGSDGKTYPGGITVNAGAGVAQLVNTFDTVGLKPVNFPLFGVSVTKVCYHVQLSVTLGGSTSKCETDLCYSLSPHASFVIGAGTVSPA